VGSTITLGLDDHVTCTINNDDIAPTLKLVKTVDNGANPGGTAVPDDWTLSATAAAPYDGRNFSNLGGSGVFETVFANAGYDLAETAVAGYTAGSWSCDGGTLVGSTVTLTEGETGVTCTINNEAMGMVDLIKLTQGQLYPHEAWGTMTWNFTLTGPGVNATGSAPPSDVDFGEAYLIPGEEYTLCEIGIPAGWTTEWQVDTDGDGIPDAIIPMVAEVNYDPVDPVTGYSRVFDPNYVPPPDTYTNDTRCVNFVVDIGETLAFQIDNRYPGGEPRTPGYWKNWSTCTGGNQAATAAKNGGTAEGWYLLDDLLPRVIGDLQIVSCEDGVSILDHRDINNGKKMASDAAYKLARNLLAAQLNLAAEAETCPEVVDAVAAGNALLISIGFDGTGKYLRPKDAEFHTATDLAYTLDQYNNGYLCSP
jgi:hypothetical protein